MDYEYEALQRMVDALYLNKRTVARLDAILWAEAADLNEDLREIVELLPPVRFARQQLCDQINSALIGHGWNGRYATVG